MALPTAPLGQLGNMSMPYSIGTYDKGPNIWEKALAAFLVNAAGGVASQGTQNLMSRDYAKEFGEKPAGTWGRLVGGPAVDAKDAAQRRQNIYLSGEAQKGRDFSKEENEFNQMIKATAEEAQAKNEAMRQGERIQGGLDQQQIADMNALLRGDRENTARVSMNDADNLARLEQIDREYENRGNLPSERLNESIIQRLGLKGAGVPGVTTQTSKQFNPNVVADATGSAAATGAPQVPAAAAPAQPADYYTTLQELQAMGLSPQAIEAILGRQAAVRERVEGPSPAPYTGPDATAFGRESLPYSILKGILQPETINDRTRR